MVAMSNRQPDGERREGVCVSVHLSVSRGRWICEREGGGGGEREREREWRETILINTRNGLVFDKHMTIVESPVYSGVS